MHRWPAGHTEHAVAKPKLYAPTGHSVGARAGSAHSYPAGHARHMDDPKLYRPAVHCTGAVLAEAHS